LSRRGHCIRSRPVCRTGGYSAHTMSPHRCRGVAIAFASVLSAAPEAAVLKELRLLGADTFAIFVYKQLLIGVFFGVMHLSKGSSWQPPRESYVPVALGSVCYALSCLQTIGCIWTSTTRAYMLFYLNPIWTAAFNLVCLRERVACHTKITVCLAMIAIVIAFGGMRSRWLFGATEPKGVSARRAHADVGDEQHPSWQGDVLCAIAGLGFAGYLTCSRWAYGLSAKAPMTLAIAYGCVAASLCGFCFAIGSGRPLSIGSLSVIALLAVDVLLIAAFCGLSTLAAHYLPTAELGLILVLDIVFAPLLSLLSRRDAPPSDVLLGGAVLLVALLGHEAFSCLLSSDGPLSRSGRVSERHMETSLLHQVEELAEEEHDEEGNTEAIRA